MDFDFPAFFPHVVAWAEAQATEAAAKGSPLDEEGLALARKVGVEHPERIRVRILDELPIPDHPLLVKINETLRLISPQMGGLSLGHNVIIRNGCASPFLMAHEFRHVHQYEEAGSIAAFLSTYLHQILTVGYRNAPYEMDANERAHHACHAR